MFNLKEQIQSDQVQIISDDELKIGDSEHLRWGLGFEASALQQSTNQQQKQSSTVDKFRVRIYNVH